MHRRAVSRADRVIVRALSLAMDASDHKLAAHLLVADAGGNRVVLELAVMRMRRALYARPSPVGERALAALLEAMELAGPDAMPRQPEDDPDRTDDSGSAE